MIVGPTGAATMVIDRAWVSDSDNESVTFTVKLAVPVPVGVPEITPAELRERFAEAIHGLDSTRASRCPQRPAGFGYKPCLPSHREARPS